MIKRILFGLGVVLLLGIVGIYAFENEHRRVRASLDLPGEPECRPTLADEEVPANSIERLCTPGGAYVAYAELDDQGLFWEQDYLLGLRQFLEQRRGESELIIVMLVHGWNHSAAPADGNVACFKEILKVIDRLQVEHNYGRQVVGVFVGWRGRKYAFNGLNMALTFWNRMAVADNIGSRGDLRALIEVLRDATRGPTPRSRGALVLAGHSLGGRALFQATQSQELALLKSDATPGDGAELTVLLNPAFTAVDFEEIHRAAAARPQGDGPASISLLVAASRDDEVTRNIYPLGEKLGRVGQGTNADRDERLFSAAVGHYEDYFSHELTITDGDYDARKPYAQDLAGCPFVSEQQFIVTRTGDLYDYKNVQGAARVGESATSRYTLALKELRPGGPVMFVAVDGRIIPDHGNVYTPPFIDFLMRVVNYNVFCGPVCKRRIADL